MYERKNKLWCIYAMECCAWKKVFINTLNNMTKSSCYYSMWKKRVKLQLKINRKMSKEIFMELKLVLHLPGIVHDHY